MSMQLLLNRHIPTPPPCSDYRQRCLWANDSARFCTNDSGSPSLMTVWGFGTTSVPYFRTRFLIYSSFLINILFNADFKNAICFWRSHLVFDFLSYKNNVQDTLYINFARHSFDFFAKWKSIIFLPVFFEFS